MTGPTFRTRQRAAPEDGPSQSVKFPRQDQPTPTVAEAIADHPASRPPRLTIARTRTRPTNANARSRRRTIPAPDGLYEEVPHELLDDPTLEPIDVVLWLWLVRQRAIWMPAKEPQKYARLVADGKEPPPITAKLCGAGVGRNEKGIRESLARLAKAGHVRKEPIPGMPSRYSVPWLSVHKLGRRMSLVRD